MKNKIILPIICGMAVIVIVSLICFACRTTSSALNFDTPETIKIYFNSQSAKQTIEDGTDNFDEFMRVYNDTFKKSNLEEIAEDNYINPNLSENLEAPEWSSYNLDNGLYVELNFAKAQKLIIWRDGNSRVVYINSLIFNLNEVSGVKDIDIYYSIDNKYINETEKTEDSEIYYPLSVQGDTTKLYNFVRGLV